eukprot:3190108-Amphidinium_carterae.1
MSTCTRVCNSGAGSKLAKSSMDGVDAARVMPHTNGLAPQIRLPHCLPTCTMYLESPDNSNKCGPGL